MNQIPTVRFRSLFLLILLATVLLVPAASAQTALSFEKSFNPATIGPGSVSSLRFDITNNTSNGADGLAFTDNLPAGMTIASPASVTSDCLGTVGAPDGGSTITLSDGELAPSSSCAITVDVTSSTPGSHTNLTGTLTSTIGSGGTATADLIVATDRPGFSKSFSPASVSFGGRSTLTFTIDNTANLVSRFGLAFTDNLPANMTIASPSNASTGCGGDLSAPAGGSTILLTSFGASNATVGASSSCTVSVDVIGGAVGILDNISGELTSTDQFGQNLLSSGKASASLTISAATANITLEKSFTDDPTPPGGVVTLEFTVRNLDRNETATNISFTDDLDAVITDLVSTGLPSTPCGPNSSLTGTGLLTLSAGELAPEATCSFSATLQVPAGSTPGTYLNTTSSITADVGGATTGDPATDILVIQPVPLLSKTFLADQVGSGDSVDLEFTVENTSTTSAASDIAFIDELTSFLGFPVSATLPNVPCGNGSSIALVSLGTGSQGLSLTDGNLAAGTSCTFSVTLEIPVDQAPGSYVNVTEEITAIIDGETLTGNPATDSFDVLAPPAMTKTFIDDPVQAGDTVTLQFRLRYDDVGHGDATDITFTDDLTGTLAGLTAVGLPANNVCNGTGTISGTTNLTFSGGTLSPEQECIFDVSLQVPAGAAPGNYTNTTSNIMATVLGISATGPTAEDDLQIAGLRLAKEFTDDPAIPGDTVTLEFTLENTSLDSTATDVSFTDNLHATLDNLAGDGVLVNDVCGTGNGTIDWNGGGTFLIFSGGSLQAGETCTFSVELQVPAEAVPDTYQNVTSLVSATIDGTPNVLFDPATDNLTVETDFLALAKEFIDDPVAPGDAVTLRFTATNLSGSATVSDIAFTDDLEAALSGLASTSGTLTNVCGSGSEIIGTSLLSFTGGTLAPGASCSFDVTLLVPGNAQLGSTATNTTSEITGITGGFGVSGDPASDDLLIDFMVFTKSFASTAIAGDTVILTFNLQNLSSSDTKTDFGFTDNLDDVIPGLVATGLPVSDVCGTGSVVTGTSVIVLTAGSLLPGGSCTFDVTLEVPADSEPGEYLNITSDLIQTGLPIATPATAQVTVSSSADLSITKTDSQDPVTAGDAFFYTVSVTNNGPSAAQNVVATDTLPAGVTLLSTSGCNEDPVGVPTCSLGTLAAGAKVQYVITVLVDAGSAGVITNNASVTSETSDPDVGNNSTSEDTEIGVQDDDDDGVPNGSDVCPETVIPEGVPTVRLGVNRWALVDDDGIFDTTPPPGGGGGNGESFTIEDTAGCSCEQIIAEMGLGNGHVKFGCSTGAMRTWENIVEWALFGRFEDGFEWGDTLGWSSQVP